MLRKVIKFTLVICCMLIIFMFSSDSGTASSKKSDSVIINLVEVISNKKVNNKDRDKYIEKYVFPVRKCAHFTIYLILGILVISLLSEYRILNFKTVLYTLLIVFLYACSDEFHQLFVSGRSSEIGDVLIDSSGALLAILILSILFMIIKGIKNIFDRKHANISE